MNLKIVELLEQELILTHQVTISNTLEETADIIMSGKWSSTGRGELCS